MLYNPNELTPAALLKGRVAKLPVSSVTLEILLPNAQRAGLNLCTNSVKLCIFCTFTTAALEDSLSTVSLITVTTPVNG